MAFDSELVARTIAHSPVPVFTGIGHETDRAIADEAAHSSYKTPTACAHALVSMVRDYVDRCEAAWAAAQQLSRLRLGDHDARLTTTARRAAAATSRLLTVHERNAEHVAHRVSSETRHALARARTRLDHHTAAVGAASTRRLRQASSSVEQHVAALAIRPGRSLARAERALDALAARARAHDPARVLARGFTITRAADGTVLRSAAELATGDPLATTFADGTARSVVVAIEPAWPASPGLDPTPQGTFDR
jgi:exodeoxyribonuclease VII large subunit